MTESARRLCDTLSDLLEVLGAENKALRRMDAAGVDAASARKSELCAELTGMVGLATQQPGEREQLRRVRALALENQLLSLHAADSIKRLLTGDTAEFAALPGQRPAATSPLRLSVRG